MPTIEGHHDFDTLERRLAELIREARGDGVAGALAPVAVVAPTRLLIAHLQSLLAGCAPALLNVHFFHHASLARAAAGREPSRTISREVEEAILGACLETVGGDLASYARARPGSVAALGATLRDLREAGVPAGAGEQVPDLSPGGAELLRLYDAYVAALDRLASRGWIDRAGLIRGAARRAKAAFGRFRLLVHFGAYELIGANLELLNAIESSGVRVVYLVPFHPSAPAYEHARRFWAEAFGAAPRQITAGGAPDRLLADALPRLYDDTARPSARQERPVSLFQSQGAEAELREVALRILALHRDHAVPLARVAVVARTLEPYAPLLRAVFSEHGLPFTTTASLGALREPRVLASLHLARAVLGDFERQPLMDLCRSGLLRHRDGEAARQAHAWDRLSREWNVTRGAAAWTRELPGWVRDQDLDLPDDADEALRDRAAARREAQCRQAQGLADLVAALDASGAPWRTATGWRAWAAAAATVLRRHIDGLDEQDDGEAGTGAGLVLDRLADMGDLEECGVRFSAPAALANFERALGIATVPIGAADAAGAPIPRDGGGVRILDAMQARGLAFDAVYVIGLNADLFPRRAREDPFLGDADRRRLRARLSLPLAVKSAGRDEEHLLLAHLLGAARRWLTVSWQRAEDTGQARVPSLALREVARVIFGEPDLGKVHAAARRVPAHPAEAGRQAVDDHGLLPLAAARQTIALHLRSPARLLEELPRLPSCAGAAAPDVLRAGLAMLRVVEDETSGDLSYDASIGEAAPAPGIWSPSRIERLGACPQHFFFRHVLRVEEMEEPPPEYELEAIDIGRCVHDVLRDTYRALLDEEDLAASPEGAARAARRAAELAPAAWERHTQRLADRVRARYPLLWETTSTLWVEALVAFLRADVARLARDGWRVTGIEEEVRARLDLAPPGAAIDLRGRLDRVLLGPGGEVVIGDYKTAGDLDRHVQLAEGLKGARLQMPLYLLMGERLAAGWGAPGGRVRAEVLGVGPSFAAAGAGEAAEGRVEIDSQKFDRIRAGLLETIGALVGLAAAGDFPLNPDSRLCGYCPYARACRRRHTPTLERLAGSPGGSLHALLRLKNTRVPTLEAARRAPGAGAEP